MRQESHSGSQKAWRKTEIRILEKQCASPIIEHSLHLSADTADRQERRQLMELGTGLKSGPYFTHLQLKEAPLLLHFFRDLGPGDLRADEPVLFGMLPFLLLDFCTVIKTDAII